MNKTVSSVIDDINEWENPHGGYLYFVTAMFTDESVGSVGKKTEADARTVQAQLQDAIGEELDFTLEDGGTSKAGRQKWKITGFGPPGGAATYTAPSSPGGGTRTYVSGSASHSPEHDQERSDSIARAVALKAAAIAAQGLDTKRILAMAEEFETWLKTSEPASSAYGSGGNPSGASVLPSTATAGAGSEDQSAGPSLPADSGEEVGEGSGGPALGEGTPASTPHEHDWQLRQGVKGFLVCEICGKTRKKEVVRSDNP